MSESSDPKKSSAVGLPLRWPPLVTDDAGTSRRLVVLENPDAELRQLMARLSSHLTRKLFDPRILVSVLLLLVALLIPGLLIVELLLRGSTAARYALFLGIGGVLAGGNVMLGRRQVLRDSGSFVATLLAMGRCGCCGYALDELPVGESGLSTCPECGAAWRATRIGRPSDHDSPRLQVAAPVRGDQHLLRARREIAVIFAPWSGRRTVIDARGRIVELVRDPLLRRHSSSLESSQRARLEELLQRASIPRRKANGLLLLGFSIVPLLVSAAMVADLVANRSWIDLGSVVVTVMGLGVAAWMMTYACRLLTWRTGYAADGMTAALIDVGRCPSCGDPLPAANRGSDDAVRVCGGCGAAWPPS